MFSDRRQHKLTIPALDKDGKAVTVAFLIDHLCDVHMTDSRKDLFVLEGRMCV